MTLFGSSVPIEFFLYGAVGFLAAWLMALACFPAVHRRAQRLLRRQYEQTPLSLQELRAEKDQLRAGFAAATCDLERNIERLKEKTSAHATDIARKAKQVERLTVELAGLNETLAESTERERKARVEMQEARAQFETLHGELGETADRERDLRAQLRELRRELAIKDQALDAALQEVADIRSEIARIAPMLPAVRAAPVVSLAPDSERAFAEIDAAARRVDQRYEGMAPGKPISNRNLRAIYAPAMTPADGR